MATGSSLTQNHSRSQTEIQGDLHKLSLTAAEYASQYDKRREREYSRFHGYAYDGIWAIALAIQTVAQKLKAKGRHLKEFQYRDPFWGQLFRDAFNETSFTGVTGPVNFIKNERRSQILLKQFQNGSEVKIGEYDPVFDELDFSKGVPIIWTGGGPPADRTHRKITKKRISITVYSILVTFAIFGIIISTVFLIVNIKYRNQRTATAGSDVVQSGRPIFDDFFRTSDFR
ncbi:gamma-aminobutyric acid type B receptor subunit 2 [Trichonephila clavipes]|nr:gamma-aminobutyric acid type B receptor subunit 2 [Trichonephila clavipes]